MHPGLIPSAEDAARQYSAAGGHLTDFSVFGEDPLTAALCSNEKQNFCKDIQFDPLFHKLVNGDEKEFCDALHPDNPKFALADVNSIAVLLLS